MSVIGRRPAQISEVCANVQSMLRKEPKLLLRQLIEGVEREHGIRIGWATMSRLRNELEFVPQDRLSAAAKARQSKRDGCG